MVWMLTESKAEAAQQRPALAWSHGAPTWSLLQSPRVQGCRGQPAHVGVQNPMGKEVLYRGRPPWLLLPAGETILVLLKWEERLQFAAAIGRGSQRLTEVNEASARS